MGKKVGIGLIGSQFMSAIPVEALKSVQDAQVLAVMSPTKGNALAFAKKHMTPVIFAAYESAGTGKKVMLPFSTKVDKPYKLRKKNNN